MDPLAQPTTFMHNNGMVYTSTPSPPQSFVFSNPFTPSQQLTPQEEFPDYNFFDSMHGGNRSLSSPYIFGPAPGAPVSMMPTAAPPAPHKYPISPNHMPPRQKAKRTPTACEECRKRKQKCDGEAPCQSCKEQKLKCDYREVPPTKKDNSLEKLVEIIVNLGEKLSAMSERMDVMDSTLREIEQRVTLPPSCWQCGTGFRC